MLEDRIPQLLCWLLFLHPYKCDSFYKWLFFILISALHADLSLGSKAPFKDKCQMALDYINCRATVGILRGMSVIVARPQECFTSEEHPSVREVMSTPYPSLKQLMVELNCSGTLLSLGMPDPWATQLRCWWQVQTASC